VSSFLGGEGSKARSLFKLFRSKHLYLLFIVGSWSYIVKGILMEEPHGVVVVMFWLH